MDIHRKTASFYEFAGFRLDVANRVLVRQGQPVDLTPKVFDTLLLLVQNSGQILEKDELMRALWPDSFVEEGNLSQNIFVLRKTLGDDRNGNSLIQTIPRRGYRFVASIKQIDGSAPENGGLGSPSTLIADYWNCHSPFRSLQTFEPEDAWLFFGRDHEINDILEKLARFPVLAVIGNSGCGKSSLVRAGLIPALQSAKFFKNGAKVDSWHIAVFRPSGSPFDYLAEVLASQLAPELCLKEHAEFIADCRNKLASDPAALRNAITALLNATEHREKIDTTHVLLVADQFEEIFTLTAKQQARESYINALLAASGVNGAIAIHVVLVLRADFYAQCLEHEELSQSLQTNLYNVPRMNPKQLRESMERRLQMAAAQAEPGLIEGLLEEVGAEPGNLALLEHALGQLWDRCGGFGCTLTNQAYTDIGRLRGALERHADGVYASLGNDQSKKLAQKIFLELVHLGEEVGIGNSNDTRRRVSKSTLLSLGDANEVEQLLARLASSRLISTGESEQSPYVEVSHEALIREWSTLREWIATHRDSLRLERRLVQAAQEWVEIGRDPGALLQGARLAQAEEWLGTNPNAPASLSEFFHYSIAARDRAAHRKLIHSHLTSYGLGLLLLLTTGVAFFVYRLQLNEKSRALAAQAEEMQGRDGGLALGLAMRAWRTAKTEEARLAVTKTFPTLIATLDHDARVQNALFSPDGRRVVTASDDNSARVWNSENGHLLATLLGHTGKIIYAEFSPDGERIVTTSFDRTARIWRSADGAAIFTLQGHVDKLAGARFSPDGQRIITASWDCTARIWSSVNGSLLATLKGHTLAVTRAFFSNDGKRILTSSWDGTIRVWDGATYSLLVTLKGNGPISDAQFSPDRQRIVAGGGDHTARVWNSADGRLIYVFQHSKTVLRVAFSPDGRNIATASFDQVHLWNLENGNLLTTFRDHSTEVTNVTFSSDGRLILTDSRDSSARVWSAIDGHLLATMQGSTQISSSPTDPSEIPSSSTFSPDGHLVVAALGDTSARIWGIANAGQVTSVIQGDTGVITKMTVSPDGRYIATTSPDATTKIWNRADGHLVRALRGRIDSFYDTIFSADGNQIITVNGDITEDPQKMNTARVWTIGNGKLVNLLQGHTGFVIGAQFSPDRSRIVTTSTDHTARIWSSSDGHLLIVLRGHSDSVRSAQFSPNGKLIVTTSDDQTARIWNSEDGSLRATLPGVSKAHFSPDGQSIVTAGYDHDVRVWNSFNGRLLITLQGHSGGIWDAQFSPDGQRIVTASIDHNAGVWNSSDGRLLFMLQGHSDVVRKAQFLPSSQYIVTASYDYTARVWNSTNGRLLTTLAGHTNVVSNIGFCPEEKCIITSSFDQTVRIWHVVTLADIQQIFAKKPLISNQYP